jgi:hypothetical protein
VRVGVRLPEVEQVLTARLKQAVDVEHRDPRLRLLEGKALLRHGGGDQAGQTVGGGPGAEEEDPLVTDFAVGDLAGGDQAGERHAARGLRDPAELDKLSAEDRNDCLALWAQVGAILSRCGP